MSIKKSFAANARTIGKKIRKQKSRTVNILLSHFSDLLMSEKVSLSSIIVRF